MQNTGNQSPEDQWDTEATGSRKGKANLCSLFLFGFQLLGEKYKKAVKAVDVIDYILASSIVG